MARPPKLKSVMTPFPHTVDIQAPIDEVRTFMQERQIRHLPVTEEGQLAGIVTDRDIKLVLGPDFDYPSARELTARDVYQPEAYVVDIDTRLDAVLEEMSERRIGSALVTRKGRLAGLLTVTDVCRAFAEHLRKWYPDDGGDAAA